MRLIDILQKTQELYIFISLLTFLFLTLKGRVIFLENFYGNPSPDSNCKLQAPLTPVIENTAFNRKGT